MVCYHSKTVKAIFKVFAFMTKQASKKKWMKVISIGKTVNGADTPLIQIIKAGKDKPNIWIEAGSKVVKL